MGKTRGLLWLLASLLATPADPAQGNLLEGHPSPYLSMHGQDPVAWRIWGRDTIERARKEDRLLFVSSGYFSCHWCHVMQKQSYRNLQIAEFLNTHFVAVKVDRELQPSLDAYLIEFVQRTQGHAGWPLNVFLTPEGYPLAGITYLPPDDFLRFLRRLRTLWDAEKTELKRMAMDAAHALSNSRPAMGRVTQKRAEAYLERFRKQSLELADEMSGGFGNQAKFPSYPQLRVLLQYQAKRPAPQLADFLKLTLDQMALQGLRDQIGGGFFRYTVDPDWQVPHFEKMLYDNAQLVELYLHAALLFDEPSYETVARDTLDFLLREMWDEKGAFISSLSAVDDNNVEGGYYLWDETTLQAALSAQEMLVARYAWGLEKPAPFEAGHLPRRVADAREIGGALKLQPDTVKELETSLSQKLLAQRRNRIVPRDTKVLAGWNGLALAALARAAALPDGAGYRDRAEELRDYLVTVLWDGRELARSRHGDDVVGTASIEDYAYVAYGLLAWADLKANAADYELARSLVREAWCRFHEDTGWQLAEKPLLPAAPIEPILADGPLASPSATVLAVSLELAERLDDAPLRARALEALGQNHLRLETSPFAYASHLILLARYADALGAATPSTPVSPAASP